MERYQCFICGYIYSPSVGIPSQEIPAGTDYEELPGSYFCPDCHWDLEALKKLEAI